MATRTNTRPAPRPNSRAPKPTATKKDPITDELTRDYGSARDIFQTNFPTAPLGELDASRSAETQNALNLRQAYADPHNASFAGANTPQVTEELSRLFAQSDPNSASFTGRIDPTTQSIIDQYAQRADPNSANYAGRMSPETAAIIAQYRDAANPNSATFAGRRSADMQDVISRLKGGLEGYSAAESQVFREQAAKGMEDQYRTDARRLQINQGRSGVRGGAAGAQFAGLDRQRLANQMGLESDLFVKNADEKQRRLQNYGSTLGGLEESEYGRARNALTDYGKYYGDTESELYGRGKSALADYGTFYTGAENQAYNRGAASQDAYRGYLDSTTTDAYNRGQGAIKSYEDLLHGTQATEQERDIFNIGQRTATQARDVGGITGLVGLLNTRRSAAEQNRILAGNNRNSRSTAKT